jgi:hypothetical protein
VQRGELHRHAADVDGLEHRERVQVAELADVPDDLVQRRDLRGRRELPGDRPARVAPHRPQAPLELERVDLDHDAVDLEVQPARRSCQARHWATTSSSLSSRTTSGLTRKPCSRSHASASEWRRSPAPPGRRCVAEHLQRPLGRQPRVELADRPRGRVARVHERRLARLRAALVERREVGQGHVDLAAHLEQRRGVLNPQRDRRDRAQVVGDVLADLAVAAGGAPLELAVAVEQRHRQAVDLRLADEREVRVLDALAGQVVAHPRHPGAQLLLRAGVGQGEHGLQVLDLLQLGDRLAADPLGRGVRRDELGVVALDGAQLVEQRVVGVVADLRDRRGRSTGGRGASSSRRSASARAAAPVLIGPRRPPV